MTVRPRLPGVEYVAFADPASGTGRDSFTMAIGHKRRDPDQDMLEIDALWEARPPFSAIDVVKGFADALKTWRLASVMGDDFGGGSFASMFAKQGIAYQSSPLTASELYLHTLPSWTSSMVSMVDCQRAVDQICGLRRKVASGGKESVVHLGNQHDDFANVVAGVLYRLTPREAVAWDYAGIGVISTPRVYIGETGEASDTMKAWTRTQGYARAPDGGLGKAH
jgi:hypothetical protein